MLSPRKTVTLADVAKAANVSKTTASHALSGRGYVSAITREVVVRMASEMGFSVDPLARLLSNGRCEKTIGFFTLDLDLSSRTRQLQIMQAQLNDMGYNVPIYAYGYRGRDELRAQIELMQNLLAQRPAAIICNTSGVRREAFEPLQNFQKGGGVVVCYGYEEPAPLDCDQVLYNEGGSFETATRFLLEHGHREIGLFSVGHRKPCGAVFDGFARAMTDFGAPIRDEWLFENDGTRRYEEDGQRLGWQFLALSPRPSAMIVANDYAATAFIATLHQNGVQIPAQLSVVGHDNDAIAPFAATPLTTVGAPIEDVSQKVVEMLESRLLADYSGPPRHHILNGEMVVRDSVARKI